MKKIKTVVADDEPLALGLLCSYLQVLPNVEIVATCNGGRQALEAAAEYEPDLMFLDIQMPGMTGYEVAKRLQADLAPLIVFATAYDEYAVSAFDLHAVDYILKPLDRDRVAQAVQRAAERLSRGDSGAVRKQGVMAAIQGQDVAVGSSSEKIAEELPGKLVIKDREAIHLIDQEDIAWIDAAGDYMCVHVGAETHIMRSTMKQLLAQLDEALFKRVHRSTIVNMRHIKQIITHTKGEYFLLLGEHDRVKVSRNYRNVVKDYLARV